VDLIGCNNDEPFLTQMHPRPATIDIALEKVGQRAVEQLLRRIANPMEPVARLILEPHLIGADLSPALRKKVASETDRRSA
jgi:LacI family transcriptional regulator